MFYESSYFYIVLPAVIFALIANANVKSTFNRYSKQYSASGMTGAQAAQRVMSVNGIYNVKIERIDGRLTDHYDPRANVVRLSSSVYNGTSTAAIGVACHEIGHVLQYAEGYGPIKFRAVLIPITNIGSRLAVPLIIMGFILGSLSSVFETLAYAGIILYAVCAFFQLVTLPVEFNASNRALKSISGLRMLNENEYEGARKVLNAAALTYVAALAVSLANLLRFISIANRRR